MKISTNPRLRLAVALGVLVGLMAVVFAGMAPTLLVVLTSAVASSAGFLGAILVAQSVWAHQRQSPSVHL